MLDALFLLQKRTIYNKTSLASYPLFKPSNKPKDFIRKNQDKIQSE